ncbi:putative BTB/POZ domain-containing protein [Septoria linicola]|nr:putative BTB/POZ domain-containing protein [Septoria linicola]
MADTTVATNEIAVDEAALSGHIHNTLPVVDMNAVFDTVLVKIVVGDQSKYVKAFTVPREQVCASSTTLKSASKSVFQETDSKVFALQDYQPAAFAVFLEYIYTLKIGLT